MKATAEKQNMTKDEIKNKIEKKLICIQYRGKCTEEYARSMHNSNAPLCTADDAEEAENCPSITETFCGEALEKQGCVSTHMSALQCVLCWSDWSTSTSPTERASTKERSRENTSRTLPEHFDGR